MIKNLVSTGFNVLVRQTWYHNESYQIMYVCQSSRVFELIKDLGPLSINGTKYIGGVGTLYSLTLFSKWSPIWSDLSLTHFGFLVFINLIFRIFNTPVTLTYRNKMSFHPTKEWEVGLYTV